MTRGRAHPLTVEEPTITMTVSGIIGTHSSVSRAFILLLLAHSRCVGNWQANGYRGTVNRMIHVTDVYQIPFLFLGIEFLLILFPHFLSLS